MGFWSIAAPIIGSVASGLLGASGARSQGRAIERANAPKPFWSRQTQEPWGPASNPLQEAIAEAMAIHRRNVNVRPPPSVSTSGIRGPSSQLRGLAEAMRERALNSQFIPQAQARMLEMASGTNPMVQSAFNRAEGYSNPLLEMLQSRAMSYGGAPGAYNNAAAPMSTLLQNLMGGQRYLGEEGPYTRE